MAPAIEPTDVVRLRDCLPSRQRGFWMRHQLSSMTVDSANSLLSLGFACAGLSSASLNFCQSLELSSKCRASDISCSARTHALSSMKFVMFTPRCSAPRRMSLASLSLTRKLNLSVRFFCAAVVGIVAPLRTYTRLLSYVQCTLILRTCQAAIQLTDFRSAGLVISIDAIFNWRRTIIVAP